MMQDASVPVYESKRRVQHMPMLPPSTVLCTSRAIVMCAERVACPKTTTTHKNKDIQRHLARARIAPPASQSVRSRQRVASHDARFAERMIPSVDIISSLAIDCMLEEMSKSNHSAALSPPTHPLACFHTADQTGQGPSSSRLPDRDACGPGPRQGFGSGT